MCGEDPSWQFLTTVSRNIYYRTAQFVMKKEATEYLEAIKEIIATYNRAGFCVAKILADNEFQPLEESLRDDFDIEMNFAAAQEHVPEAE